MQLNINFKDLCIGEDTPQLERPVGKCADPNSVWDKGLSHCQISCARRHTPIKSIYFEKGVAYKNACPRMIAPGCVCKYPYFMNKKGVCVDVSECKHDEPLASSKPHVQREYEWDIDDFDYDPKSESDNYPFYQDKNKMSNVFSK